MCLQIESVIGRKIPVPQSWRDVAQSHANQGVMSGNLDNPRSPGGAADDAQYKSMAKAQKAADAGGGGGFVAMECKLS